MSQVMMFNHPDFQQIRIIEVNGKPYAVGIDVTRALQYSNPSKAIIDHCKGVTKLGIPSGGGIQETNVIPESDIYRLVIKAADQSKNLDIQQMAEKFERWVFEEVLPSIRKTGTYGVQQLPQNYKEALIALVGEVERREQVEEQLQLQAPKVALYDTAMNAKNNHTMERVSKTLGYGRNKLFDFLREKKVLRNNNMPYQEYLDRGYFDVRQYSITHFTTGIENKTQTLVTPKGMAYIHKLLVEEGKISA